jgi:deleted-in-malignant-brain-tumors protein 1
LVGGTVPREGRVEVCVNFNWGTVCDDFWGTPDATVVCRQLGYSDRGAVARSLSFFGQGTDLIVLDDVMCTGTESRLIDCPATSTHNCIHLEDAGVTCLARKAT